MNRRTILRISAILAPSIAVLAHRERSDQDAAQKRKLVYFNEAIAKKHPVIRGFENINENIGKPLEHVSLVKLIADPEEFHGNLIRVNGYLKIGHQEDTAIYLSNEDSEYGISRNGLCVDIDHAEWKKYDADTSDFENRFVAIEGIFDKDMAGIANSFAGGIHTIWLVSVLSKLK